MTDRDSGAERTINVDYLARVEGEGALTIRYGPSDQVEHVALRIFEPPRFFEAFLQGRSCLEAPDITARICGICPVAYQMSACKAVEAALSVAIPPHIAALRRLLYCGEWIESHVLHMVMLHAPDFLGFADAMGMAAGGHGDHVRAGLRIKKAGNRIVSVLGGREIHPINVRVGGFYRLPRRSEMAALASELDACRKLMVELIDWLAGFDYPTLERDYTFVSLVSDEVYPFTEGQIGSNRGPLRDAPIPDAAYRDHFEEIHVARSNALHSRLKPRDGEVFPDDGAYLCGPLARFALNFERLPDDIRQLAARLGLQPPVSNPFQSLLVRGLEAAFALGEGARIARDFDAYAEPAAVDVGLCAGEGHGSSEAPRGLLWHRYAVDDEGRITTCDIVPPTSQNQRAIEADLWAIAPALAHLDDEAATLRAEQTIRNYDPCISCATHFLTLRRERPGGGS